MPPRPLGAYVEAVQSGSLLFLGGMLPIKVYELIDIGLRAAFRSLR